MISFIFGGREKELLMDFLSICCIRYNLLLKVLSNSAGRLFISQSRALPRDPPSKLLLRVKDLIGVSFVWFASKPPNAWDNCEITRIFCHYLQVMFLWIGDFCCTEILQEFSVNFFFFLFV